MYIYIIELAMMTELPFLGIFLMPSWHFFSTCNREATYPMRLVLPSTRSSQRRIDPMDFLTIQPSLSRPWADFWQVVDLDLLKHR
jgi:hypothetical protein